MRKIYTNIVFSFLGILMSVSSSELFGQMYVQGKIQYSFFDHHKPLELVDVKPNFSLGFGVMIFADESSKIELASEVNSFRRGFHQKIHDEGFEYWFGGMDFRLLTNYSLTEKWYAQAGVIAALYGTSVTRANFEKVQMGEGFSDHDYGVFIGSHYFLTNSFMIGGRFDLWFKKMLEYDLIGDYGDVTHINDIRTNTVEIFIRFQFLNKWK